MRYFKLNSRYKLLIGVSITYLIFQWFIIYGLVSYIGLNYESELDIPKECPRYHIEEGETISTSFFYQNYVAKHKPVIISGAMRNWTALYKWTNEYLKQKLGDTEVGVAIGNRSIHFGVTQTRSTMKFSKFVDHISTPNQTELYYVNLQRREVDPYSMKGIPGSSMDTAKEFFADDWQDPPFMGYHNLRERNFWMGIDGIISRAHHDGSENILAQVAGQKRFLVFPPSQGEFLYPFEKGLVHFSQVDLDRPDLVKFPKMLEARHVECIVSGGEMLYVPSDWWHQVYSMERNIALNFWYDTHSKMKRFLVMSKLEMGFE